MAPGSGQTADLDIQDVQTLSGVLRQLGVHDNFDEINISHGGCQPEEEGVVVVPAPPKPVVPTPSELGSMNAFLEIVEQPAHNSLRFRYKSDGGAGALWGQNSTEENKTFPKIKIHGFSGRAQVVVSCVTHAGDKPKVHPHRLISPKKMESDEGRCLKGVCTTRVKPDMTFEFKHLGIQCMTQKDVNDALAERKGIQVDPFRQGYEYNRKETDLNTVRLCFQAFLEDPANPGRYKELLPPVVSEPIVNTHRSKGLKIVQVSDNSAPAEGGKKIIILCERIDRDDIKVRFFHEDESWEGFGVFKPKDVHQQVAICFTTPAYHPKVPKQVKMELSTKNGKVSEPCNFTFTSSMVQLTEKLEEMKREPFHTFSGGTLVDMAGAQAAQHVTVPAPTASPLSSITTDSTPPSPYHDFVSYPNTHYPMASTSHEVSSTFNNFVSSPHENSIASTCAASQAECQEHQHTQQEEETLSTNMANLAWINKVLGLDGFEINSQEEPSNERVVAKRPAKAAEIESAEIYIPRKNPGPQTATFDQPGPSSSLQVSTSLNTPNASGTINMEELRELMSSKELTTQEIIEIITDSQSIKSGQTKTTANLKNCANRNIL